jgi:hypothetical protein
MRNLKAISLLLLPLLGCFAQLENPSITLTHNLCGGSTNCMPGNLPLGLIQISGQNTFTVDFGDQPLLQPSSELGPATLNTSLILNGAMMQLQDPASGNFNNVASITLYAAPTATTDCTAGGSNCTVLADFDSARDGTANQSIVLRGHDIDLINYIATSSHSLELQFVATGGNGPANAWNANVSMDMGLKARANFP